VLKALSEGIENEEGEVGEKAAKWSGRLSGLRTEDRKGLVEGSGFAEGEVVSFSAGGG